MPFGMFNHPFLFAAVAVVAIGVVVYELIENSRRRQPVGRRPPSPPPPGDRPGPYPGDRPGPYPGNRPRAPPGNRPRPPPGDRPDPPPDNRPGSPSRADDSRKSLPGNNLRKRNINQTSSKENASEKLEESKNQKDSKTAIGVAPKTSVENLTKTSSTEGSQNSPDKKFDENNYCKNMLDKLTSDTKNVNENIKGDNLGHNIYEEESDSSESNLLPKSEEKVINQATSNENICNSKKPHKRKRKTKCNIEKSAKNHIEKKHDNCSGTSDHYETGSSSDSQSDNSAIFSPVKVTKASPIQQNYASKNACDQSFRSQSSDLYPKLDFHPLSNLGSELVESSLSSDEDEDIYKKDMLKAFKNDLQNCEIINNTDNSVTCSSENTEKEETLESKLCKGCEENHVNTRACPCNHAYLCVDCAMRVFRLSKICTICLQNVEEFVQFSL